MKKKTNDKTSVDQVYKRREANTMYPEKNIIPEILLSRTAKVTQ